MHRETRRRFLKTSAGAAFAATLAGTVSNAVIGATPSPAALPIKKGILLSMLPASLSYAERLKLAHEIGFEVLQAPTEPDERKAEELRKAADAAQIRIDSVMNMDHWKYPLSSSDPSVVEKSLAGMRTSLHNAKLWGSDVVLLVPAVLDPQTSYREAWARSQREIRKLLPLAEELKVVIAIEEVAFVGVGCGDDGFDTILGRQTAHLARYVPGLGTVVNLRENMGMNVDHVAPSIKADCSE